MNALVFISILFLLQVKAENETLGATSGCVDELENCPTLASQGFCKTTNDDGFFKALKCARSCNLCTTHTMMHIAHRPRHNIKTNSRPKNTRTVQHSNSHSNQQHSRPKNVRKPVSRPKVNAKRTPVRPKTRVKARRPPTKSHARKPAKKIRAHRPAPKASKQRNQVRSKTNQRRHPAARPRASKPAASVDAKFQPIGPNQLRIKSDVILASQLIEIKNNAIDVNFKFGNLNKIYDMIVNGLEQVLDEINEEIPSFASKVLLNDFNMFQPRMKSLFNRIGRWKATTRVVHKNSQEFVTETRHTNQNVYYLRSSVTKQQTLLQYGFTSSRLMVSKNLKPNVAYDFNLQETPKRYILLANSLNGFAFDFQAVSNELEQLLKNMEPISALIQKILALAEGNGNVQEAKNLVQQSLGSVKKIKEDVVQAAGVFSKATTDFGGIADFFDKNRKDLEIERKPVATEMMPKKREEPKNDEIKKEPKAETKPKQSEKPKEQPKNGDKPPKTDEKPKPNPEQSKPSSPNSESKTPNNSPQKDEPTQNQPNNNGKSNPEIPDKKESQEAGKQPEKSNDAKSEPEKPKTGNQEQQNEPNKNEAPKNEEQETPKTDQQPPTQNEPPKPDNDQNESAQKDKQNPNESPKTGDEKPKQNEPPKADEDLKDKDVTIQCSNDKYLTVITIPVPAITCDKAEPKTEQERFHLSVLGEKVNLRAYDGSFCVGTGPTGFTVRCSSRDQNEEWAQFDLVKNDDGTVSFKCKNGNYLDMLFSTNFKCASTDANTPSSRFRVKVAKS